MGPNRVDRDLVFEAKELAEWGAIGLSPDRAVA
jgi:hypothetical protein